MLQPNKSRKNGASSYGYGSLAGPRLDPQLAENGSEETVHFGNHGAMEPAIVCARAAGKNSKIIMLLTLTAIGMLFLKSSGGTVVDIASRALDQLGSAIQVKSAVQLGESSSFAMQLSSCTSCVDSMDGFASSNIYSPDNNPRGKLHWYCAPDSWTPIEGKREGEGGSWSVDDVTHFLTIFPPARKDYWRKTYYQPTIIKDDGPFLYATLSSDKFYTVETTFVLTAIRQFDQAGILIRLGPEHWLKTGIEVVDHLPRLSCVVTNAYSDWSTQAWSNYTTTMVAEEDDDDENTIIVKVYAQIRVHCRGTDFVVEAKMPSNPSSMELGGGPSVSQEWQFIRIAHMAKSPDDTTPVSSEDDATLVDAAPQSGTFWAGVFAASPEDQQGGHVTFTQFTIHEGSHFEHNANGNQDN